MRIDLTDKAVLVTGAARGIGASVAELAADAGARVLMTDRDAAALESRAAALGQPFAAHDVTDAADWARVLATARERLGGLDVLVNNAGQGGLGRTPDLDPAEWRRLLAVNLDSVFLGCRAAIPLIAARGGGAIVNVASISGLAGDYGFSAYNAAKGAVLNYTRTLALDHAREGVRVNAVCPGLVDTAAVAPALAVPGAREAWAGSIPLGRAAHPVEIARVILFLASDLASYVTGAAWVADGGATAHTGQPNLPGLLASLSPDQA